MEEWASDIDADVGEVDVKFENKVEADKPFKLFERNRDENHQEGH